MIPLFETFLNVKFSFLSSNSIGFDDFTSKVLSVFPSENEVVKKDALLNF